MVEVDHPPQRDQLAQRHLQALPADLQEEVDVVLRGKPHLQHQLRPVGSEGGAHPGGGDGGGAGRGGERRWHASSSSSSPPLLSRENPVQDVSEDELLYGSVDWVREVVVEFYGRGHTVGAGGTVFQMLLVDGFQIGGFLPRFLLGRLLLLGRLFLRGDFRGGGLLFLIRWQFWGRGREQDDGAHSSQQ